jgi:hypothetical protein
MCMSDTKHEEITYNLNQFSNFVFILIQFLFHLEALGVEFPNFFIAFKKNRPDFLSIYFCRVYSVWGLDQVSILINKQFF